MAKHSNNLRDVNAHFAFGKNWAAYAEKIGHEEIAEAQRGLLRLLGESTLKDQRFLDIGSGSGLHALAALREGASEVVAIDIDPDSVATTQAVLKRFAPDARWRVEVKSVFDLHPADGGKFDVVYSWGVLHHTGDLEGALRRAAAMVGPGGLFVFALYHRIWMDWFWRFEKRWYSKASPRAQAAARNIYIALFRLGLRLTGRRFSEYVANYRTKRGMDFFHDVHDWMGGWPYESISANEVETLMNELGFAVVRTETRRGRLLGRYTGLFGSGCDEYVYRRVTDE